MSKKLHLLLADDDQDDRFFFNKVLKALSIPTQFSSVEDGEQLMDFLSAGNMPLPDVLFLDLNMPRKNGSECLSEIKKNDKLKNLPVIMYSTSMHEDVADLLYANGAHFYIRKTNIIELQKVLQFILTEIWENRFERPARDRFVFNGVTA